MWYPLDVLIKLLAATVLGGTVGWQRELQERPAGLRTHILVCVGAVVYTLASMRFGAGADPARVAAQVATGMGFLGAGTIIRHGNVVRGLTTAASLWAVAAIGICLGVGGEGYWIGAIATAVVFLTLSVLRSVEARAGVHGSRAALTLRLHGAPDRLNAVQALLQDRGIDIESFEVSAIEPGDVNEVRFAIRLPTDTDLAAISGALARLEGFASLHCE